jgi:uncharacterized membrane protein YcfT
MPEESMQPKARIDWLDIAKGISIFFEVINHTLLYLDLHHLAPDLYSRISDIMTPIRMPLFFTVSGFLATSATQKPWREFLYRKVRLLLYLFAVWSTIRWLYFRYIQVNGLLPTEGNDLYQLVEMWWAPSTGIWFIWALAIYMVATKAVSSLSHAAVIGVAAIISLLTFGNHLPVDLFTHRNLLQYFVFFLFGCWYGKAVVHKITARPVMTAVVGFLAFSVLYVLRWRLQAIDKGAWAMASSIAGLAWLCGTAMLMSRIQRVRQAFSYFGQNTLPVYVTHVMIVSALAAMISLAIGPSPAAGYLAVPFVCIIAVGLSLAIKAAADRGGAGFLYAPPTRKVQYAPTNA